MTDNIIELINYIMCDIKDVFIYIPSFIPPVFIILSMFMFLCYLLHHKQKDKIRFTKLMHIISMVLLLCYMLIILYITIFSRYPGSRSGIDLLPFATIGHGLRADAYVLENILLFIPFGVLLPLSSCRFKNVRQVLFAGLLFSLMIELTQYMTRRGHIQTDDIIMNVLGTGIGYLIYRVLFDYRKRKA